MLVLLDLLISFIVENAEGETVVVNVMPQVIHGGSFLYLDTFQGLQLSWLEASRRRHRTTPRSAMSQHDLLTFEKEEAVELETTSREEPEQESPETPVHALQEKVKASANWFYWIAALSVINSVSLLLESDFGFVVGLGVTQVIDAIALGAAEEVGGNGSKILQAIAFGLDLLFAGGFALVGWLAGRGKAWAFVLGMTFYALDGVIFLLVQDWLSLGFHAFALFSIFVGYSALRQLKAMHQNVVRVPIEPGVA